MKNKIKKAQKYLKWKKPDQAIAELRPLLKQEAGQEFAWVAPHMLGIAFALKGEYERSAEYFEDALKYGSEEPETFHMLSVNYFNLGQLEEAEFFGKEALNRRDDFLKAWINLGSVYRSQAKLEEALRCYQKANQLDPKNAGVAFRIGEIYRNLGDFDKALKLFEITLKVDPGYVQAALEKVKIYKMVGRHEEALDYLDEVAKKQDVKIAADFERAEIFRDEGDYDKALSIYEELLREEPSNGSIGVNYALCLQEINRFDESEASFRKAIEDMPDRHEPVSNYLMGLHYNPHNTREHIFEEHLRLAHRFLPAEPVEISIPENRATDKQLRVGFVSGGFRRHPVGFMVAGALEQLPSDQFKIYCYNSNNKHDFVSRRIHRNIDVWRSIVGYNDKVVADMIRKDQIDILVDLSGHAQNSRLQMMAMKPAPIIVKWVGGLFNTTGLEAFDYLITDRHESPKGEEPFYVEKLVRMPDDYIVYTPPAYAPGVASLPAGKNGYITFGCFNNPTKVNEEVLKRWAKIMREVPGSHLFLKSKQYDTVSFRERIISLMRAHGIDRDRIEFRGLTNHDKHLKDFNKIDIALDPWPYSGGLTTCEAMYMGVPVVTLPGPTFAGRHSTTHLINAGLPELVANSWEDYNRKAIELAGDLDKLKRLRQSLRDRLLNSAVCDGKRFGAHLTVAFRRMWGQCVEGYEKSIEEWQHHIEIEPLSDQQIDELTCGPQPTPLLSLREGREGISPNDKNDEALENDDMNEEQIKKAIQKTEEYVQKLNGSDSGLNKDHTALNAATAGRQEEISYINIDDGATVCVPDDPALLTPYVLWEQDKWFDPEIDFINDYLRLGMKVVDAGAGFGVYALPMAKKVGLSGAVYAFEPGSLARRYLELSKVENGFEHLRVMDNALSDKIAPARMNVAETPELNEIGEDGTGAVSVTTLDAWWNFSGRPAIDVLKMDINGMEPEAIKGGAQFFTDSSPLIVVAAGGEEAAFSAIRETLGDLGYKFFEYIPGPGILAEHEPEAATDPYLLNVVAIPEGRLEELKKSGWIFDENTAFESPKMDYWKKIADLPWAAKGAKAWQETDLSVHRDYIEALNLLCAASEIDKDEAVESRTVKAAMMLEAAKKLIGLFNGGKATVAAAILYCRVMFQLGKRLQAAQMIDELMQELNAGKDVSPQLPFLPPLTGQDNTAVNTDFPKWLTVRIVESWIAMKNHTTYTSDRQTRQMLKALEGNPEALPQFEKMAKLSLKLSQDQSNKADESRSAKFIHLCFNHVYAQSLSDLIEYTNAASEQKHRLFIERRRAIADFSADIGENEYSEFFDFQKQLARVLEACLEKDVQAVFVHGLFFDWQKYLIENIGSRKHIGWVIWGGDLYNPINANSPFYRLAEHIDSLHSTAEGDLNICKETYGERSTYPFNYPYPGLYNQLPGRQPEEKTNTIIVGNSGDRSNRHIEILKQLANKKDIRDYKLLLPVSYNFSLNYKQELKEAITALKLQDITTLYEQFIPPRDYVNLVRNAEMLITAHNRQQSIGNILISLFAGNPTFLRESITVNGVEKKNPGWELLESSGLETLRYEDFADFKAISDVPKPSAERVESHRSIIRKDFSLENRAKQLIESCEKIKGKVLV